MATYQLIRQGETLSVNDQGHIGRPAIGMAPSEGWVMLGLVRFGPFNHIVERVPFSQLDAFLASNPQWKHKNGKARYYVEDLDHGTRRLQMSPSLSEVRKA